MKSHFIVPCIWLNDQAEQAAALYTSMLPGGRTRATSHYPEGRDNPSARPSGSVLTVEIEVAGQALTLLNGGPHFAVNPSISFFLHVDSVAEADRLFELLLEGGEVMMPLDSYPWSERYGWVKDRFGVSWQVIMGRRNGYASLVPCLMFAGPQHGRAEQAMQHYTAIFPNSRVERAERYAADEGPEGTIKHGRFVLAGQPVVAMDSHATHGITFDEGLSLQVMCEDQATLDHYWSALSQGGSTGPCGWLKDRFGLSWQVVPSMIQEWLCSRDRAARDRAFEAVMGMTKIDIAAVQRAFKG